MATPNIKLKKALQLALGNKRAANDLLSGLLALNGDFTLGFLPSSTTLTARSTAWTQTVTLTMKAADGTVHSWLNKGFTTRLSIADTSTAGTATIASTTITFVDGVATVVISGGATAWLAAETVTLTVASITLPDGQVVTGGTYVITFA